MKEALKLQEIMSQAQVFASAWSLVGGRFDGGNAMDDAEVAKNELRQMIAEALAQPQQEQDGCMRCNTPKKCAIHGCSPLTWPSEQLAQPQQEPVATAMTAHRAAYFMERFKHEEKLLGPNEQAALDFVISMLEAQPEQEMVSYERFMGVEKELADMTAEFMRVAKQVAQTEQEPVELKPCRSPYCECTVGKCAHPNCYDARHEEFTFPTKTLPPPKEPEQELVCVCGAVWEGQELVLTPLQRTWVGLTNSEWQAIVEDNSLDTIGAIKIAIEAKLKEKNA